MREFPNATPRPWVADISFIASAVEDEHDVAALNGRVSTREANAALIVHAVNTLEERERLLEEAQNVLAECLEYFEDHGDADFDGEKFIPNEEMRIGTEVRAILAKLEARDA